MLSLYSIAVQMLSSTRQEQPLDAEVRRVVGLILDEVEASGTFELERLAGHDGEQAD